MPHPFDQLSGAEIELGAAIIKKAFAGKTLHIKNIQLNEPPKAYMVKYLDAEHNGKQLPPPPRIAHSYFYVLDDRIAYEVWMDLDKKILTERRQFPKGAHPPIDQFESDRLEQIIYEHPDVIKTCESMGIKKDQMKKLLSPDGWMYGADQDEPVPRRCSFFMYMRNPANPDPDSNIYAYPLPFIVTCDVLEGKVLKVEGLATGGDGDEDLDYYTRDSSIPILETFKPAEYMPYLRPDLKMRDDLKPYNVIQPDGPSFTLEGNKVKWQKWEFRVGFTPREGLVLQDVRYDGRQTFYRLSVSEMTVPYCDPRPPIHRKQAFDLGDIGAGFAANSLELGCDCLGTIKYFDGLLSNPDGTAERRKNVVCMHEQDDGILMKHNNFRTNNARVARRRILVLQTILTVANYEYIFAWHFDQAANVELEIRATGIVSTQYIDPGKTSRWGQVVAPSVLAAYHQHLFSMRIDPAVDGHYNTITTNEVKLDPAGDNNKYGVGFYYDEKPVEQSCAFDADQSVARYVKIVNENKINPITMKPVGYKLSANPSALIFARPESTACKRAAFATHHFWVSKYRDNEFYGGGVWTNQAAKEVGGVSDMVARKEKVRNEDVVLWHSFGLTHATRIEDWPVMSQERIVVGLHPTGFFSENPAIDVPSSNQEFNRSVEVVNTRCCNRM